MPLSLVEQYWAEMYKDRNPVVVTTLLSFMLHEVVYVGRYVPFFLCDYIPALRQYKIQGTKENTSSLQWKCVRGLIFSHFCIQLPLQILFHPLAEYFGMEITNVPFPSWQTMVYQVFLFLLFEVSHTLSSIFIHFQG